MVSLMNFGLHFLILNIALLFIGAYFRAFKVSFSKAGFVLIISFLFLWWLAYYYTEHELTQKLYIATSVYLLLSAMLAFVFVSKKSKIFLSQSIEFFIWAILVILVFQQLVYFVIGGYVDLHKALTFGVYESRFESGFFSQYGLIRPTAFAVEPSNMAATLLLYSALYFQIKKKVNLKLMVMVSGSVLTLSFASILVSSVLLGVLVFYFNKKIRVYFLPLVALLSFALIYLLYARSMSASDYDAVGARLGIFDYISNQSISRHILGNGFLAFETPVILDGREFTNSQIRDSGFWVNLYFSSGLLGVVLFGCYLYRVSVSKVHFFFILIILFLKFDYMQPVFWFVILTYGLLKDEKAKNINCGAI